VIQEASYLLIDPRAGQLGVSNPFYLPTVSVMQTSSYSSPWAVIGRYPILTASAPPSFPAYLPLFVDV
jgi:hypothetical protein